jgi:hypothetical protein
MSSGLRFFRRVPILGRFVTLNLSKAGASASVGVPGFHVTSGTHGTRVTAGLPGTGLFYTKTLTASADPRARQARLRQLLEYYRPLDQPNATASDFVAAIEAQRTLGLQDADLPPALLEMRATAIEALQTTFGYRVVREVPPAASQPSSTGNYVAIGLVVSVIAMALLATWWLS